MTSRREVHKVVLLLLRQLPPLQEAGSKLSRDMIRGTYRAYMEECYMVIELIRQF